MSTHEKLQKLTDDIYELYEVDRPEIYKRIKEAYNLGVERSAEFVDEEASEEGEYNTLDGNTILTALKI